MNARFRAVLSRLLYPVALGLLLAMFAGGFYLRGVISPTSHEHGSTPDSTAGELPQSGGMESTVWTCSMHPQIRQPGPGKCPICAMDLIPLRTDDGAGGDVAPRRISFSPAAMAMMRVTTTPVATSLTAGSIDLLGKVATDETRLSTVAAWVPGRIEKMHVAFTGEVVSAGQALVTLYSPELLTAASELRLAEAALGRTPQESPLHHSMQANVEAARAKLRRWGLDAQRIEQLTRESTGDRVVVTAAVSGTVLERMGQEGMYVETGEPIYKLADLSRVWVNLEVYERDLGGLLEGESVSFVAEALPGKEFSGKLEFIDPVLDMAGRIVRARVAVDNAEGLLRPGMFVRATVGEPAATEAALVIPATAPLITGKRALVYVMLPNPDRPTFESREIVLGARRGEEYVVLNGLDEGELVVTQGNFQIDSAAQILAKPSMMNPEIVLEGWSETTFDVPEQLRAQLGEIIAAHANFSDALKHPGMPGHEHALHELQAAVNGVAHDLLPPDGHALWSELAMKISNDAAAAWKLEEPAERDAAGEQLAGRISLLKTAFNLDTGGPKGTAAPTPALQPVYEAYLGLQEALANDDETGARQRAMQLRDALTAANDLPDDWQAHQKALLSSLDAASVDKASLDEIRDMFLRVSESMVLVARQVGLPSSGSLRIAHCPMANNDEGADWLQRDSEIRNPYYGSSMLGCGYIAETLIEAEAAHAQEHHHE
ncbi:MAG: efflux RND transporter periplasmic adaptor subunit [Candidatus Hydrogenedens sp.]|nr:efflux RND transporter periplasmic adaptor subunit [Candidatus Hydrogenedens sp.]